MMPRILQRVVCGLFETAAIFSPTSRLSSVDLPAFGRPMRATWPALNASDFLLFGFGVIGRNDDLFGRDDHYSAISPDGDGIADSLVHQQRLANGALQGLFDVLAEVHKGWVVCVDSRAHFDISRN